MENELTIWDIKNSIETILGCDRREYQFKVGVVLFSVYYLGTADLQSLSTYTGYTSREGKALDKILRSLHNNHFFDGDGKLNVYWDPIKHPPAHGRTKEDILNDDVSFVLDVGVGEGSFIRMPSPENPGKFLYQTRVRQKPLEEVSERR